ncbi:MAG: T9SS C-terminal target domain-containing protein [Calditrichaeota bacterium]|nr:MAG: T9SS C-terminal target domain-containing protein [Calditrichota bacterium]
MKFINYFLLVLFFLLSVNNIAAQPTPPSGKMWQLVENMSDEFNGSTLDLDKWQQEPVGNGWVWIGRPPGLFDPAAISVADGNLRVTVLKLPQETVVNGKTFLYQGAIVRSIHTGEHGWYFEAKMKANKTTMSSTFWLMSNNNDCYTKHELDIQECVGTTTEQTASWGKNWNKIFHSNAFHRQTSCVDRVQKQGSVQTPTENWERYYVYGGWWKSPDELLFYLDGEYKYKIIPPTSFNVPMWIQMAIETYDWNPVPDGGGLVATGTWEERTTMYDWVRVYKLVDDTTASAIQHGKLLAPDQFEVRQNYPNPFNPETKIGYQLSEPGTVTLQVFDISGQKIDTLVQGFKSAGEHEVSWNGRDMSGEAVASGAYVYQISINGASKRITQTRKILPFQF